MKSMMPFVVLNWNKIFPVINCISCLAWVQPEAALPRFQSVTRFICQNLDHRNMPPTVYVSEKNKGSEQCISRSSRKFPTASIMITFIEMAG